MLREKECWCGAKSDPHNCMGTKDRFERLISERDALQTKLDKFLMLRKVFARHYGSACGRMNFLFPGQDDQKIVPIKVSIDRGRTALAFNMEYFPGLYSFVHWEDDYPNDPELKKP